MSKEEKKAIEIVKNITEDDLLNYWEGPVEPYNAIQTILQLVEKQQKEIEELIEGQVETIEKLIEPELLKKYVSKDKIKSKIEELREEIKNCYIYECNKGCLDKCKEDCEYYMFIDILQSLLEEKED